VTIAHLNAAKERRAAARLRGDCQVCCKRQAEPDATKCGICRDTHRKAQRKYDAKRFNRGQGTWCDECLACGFHRGDCPTFRTVHP
jgi:hypothetical protein